MRTVWSQRRSLPHQRGPQGQRQAAQPVYNGLKKLAGPPPASTCDGKAGGNQNVTKKAAAEARGNQRYLAKRQNEGDHDVYACRTTWVQKEADLQIQSTQFSPKLQEGGAQAPSTQSTPKLQAEIDHDTAAAEQRDTDTPVPVEPCVPLIKVRIMGKVRLAVLDNAATHAVAPASYAREARARGVVIKQENYTVAGWGTETKSREVMFLNVYWQGGSILQKFIVSEEEMGDEVLLGTTFQARAKVYPKPARGGWCTADDPETIRPYERRGVSTCHNMTAENTPPEVVDNMLAGGCFPEAERNRIAEVVARFHKRGLFTKKPGLVSTREHSIDTGDNKPSKGYARKMKQPKRRDLDSCLDKLLDDDIIEFVPGGCAWAAHPVMVPKKTMPGAAPNWRLCVD